MLADNPHTTIIQVDIRDPDAILGHPDTQALLDFSQPVGVLMVGVLLFIGPDDHPADLVATFRQRLAPGSLLAISHLCDEHAPPEQRAQVAAAVQAYQHANEQLHDALTTRSAPGSTVWSWLNPASPSCPTGGRRTPTNPTWQDSSATAVSPANYDASYASNSSPTDASTNPASTSTSNRSRKHKTLAPA